MNKNKKENENKEVAKKFNELLYKLMEDGHSHNAIMNGILFTLSLHTVNSRFLTNEVISQYRSLYETIKEELKKSGIEEDVVMYSSDSGDIPWD
tara:strand:+ start:4208 stop:4489 length:282 start_codon:yes stop_codon:yes gene_type:complete